MLDALVSAVVFALVVAVGLAVLYAVTVVPFLLAVGMAERRGFSTGRWGGLALLGVLLGLGLALAVRAADLPRVLQLLALLGVFAAPAALLVLDSGSRLGGRAGRHETPL